MADLAQRLANLTPAQRKLLEQKLRTNTTIPQPIAVVGMACRLPGAANIDEFWDLAVQGRCAVADVPAERWDVNAFYDEDPETAGKMATRWCAFIDNFDQFDALFFGITPREASRMDPQQRILLETAWESIENAGIAPERLAGTRTGVFVGIGGTDYSKLPSQFSNYHETIDAHVGTGNALSIAANRISYILDLRGPSLAVDTACSSGLVALHAAVQELRSGNCDAALAGAVNMILSPEVTIAFSKARMLSPTGHCRPFDAAADGYVRGEGCGMLMLKRLTDALNDGDNVLAIIRGTATNQDGRTSGITAPNSLSQQSCIRAALANAGLTVNDVSFVEAHGTGTPLGDPIEFQSLAKLFADGDGQQPPCYVASIKANIGHTETVSGIAGLIKVILMMQHEIIPPQYGLNELNPNIHLGGTRLQIPREAVMWPATTKRIAGVSSFGFGGTNTHVVVEAATPVVPEISSHAERPQHLLAISARTKSALPEVAAAYRQRLENAADMNIADFCYSANTGRSHFNHRAAIIADSREALLERLTAVVEGARNPSVTVGDVRLASRPRIAMLFTGQGSQYAGMGKSLYEHHPAFREVIDQCESILTPVLNKSIRDIMFTDPESLINETAYTQPALFVIEYALARLWQSWGIEPSALLGHSVGEYVAACIAGVFGLEDGLRLIAKRAELMQKLPPNGLMAVIFADRQRVEQALEPYGQAVTVATANGPENNVISGTTELVEQVVGEFEKSGVGTQRLRVSHAFHSPLMEPMLDEFESFASRLTYSRPRIPIVANRTGKMVDTADFHAGYWRDHLRNAVEFADGINCIEESGVDAYLEVGPTSSLVGMGKRCAPDSKAVWVTSLRKGRDELKTLLAAVSELYVAGAKMDWRAFDALWHRRRVSLPNYPFQRSRHWMVGDAGVNAAARGPSLHPLLGSQIRTALKSSVYEVRLSADSPRYLKDHEVQGAVVFPAAGYIEQGLAAGKLAFGDGHHAVQNLAIQQAMFLPAEGSRIVETVMAGESSGRAAFDVHSSDASDATQSKWQLHVTGSLVHESTLDIPTAPAIPDREAFRRDAIHVLDHAQIYEVFASRSLPYGPCFRVIHEFMRDQNCAICRVTVDDAVRSKLDQYTLHPAIGDAMLQLTAGVIPLQENRDHAPYTYVPMRIREVRVVRPVEEVMWAMAVRTSADDRPSPENVEADVWLLSQDNQVIAEARGVWIQRIGRPIVDLDREADNVANWLHRVEWQPQSLDETGSMNVRQPVVVFGSTDGVAAQLVAAIRAAGGRSVLVEAGSAMVASTDSQGDVSYQVHPTDDTQLADLLESLASSLGDTLTFVHTWACGTPSVDPDEDLTSTVDRVATSAWRLVQQLVRSTTVKRSSLCLVTQCAQQVSAEDEVHVHQAPLWGLARVAALEAPDLAVRIVDLDDAQPVNEQVALLLQELDSSSDENQVAYRDRSRFVARLMEVKDTREIAGRDGELTVPLGSDYRLRIADSGSFDALYYEPFVPPTPLKGYVDVEIRATGLNFSDVLKALGLYPGITDAIVPLGIECAGIVRAVGPGVDRFKVGDEVMGVAPYSFASRTVTAEYALVHKPKNLDFQEAATIPITFLTAYYALVRLAHLQKGERVLIHAAAGGVGLAAIQIAKHVGAEIFATAGSQDKRDFLAALGVEHIMSSRTLDFADTVLQKTNRHGVDVVLNSLPGDAIEKSLDCLNAYGRFLEIGKTDIYSNTKIGLLPFQDNLSYFAIDLDRMLRQRGEYIRDMFIELMQHFEQGHLQPLPFTEFDTADIVEAFRYMAQRKNIGKVVVTMQPVDHVAAAAPAEKLIRADATYLITGGLGALGLQVADQLAKEGASHVALMGRRGPDESAMAIIARLQEAGLHVAVIQGDVGERASLAQALVQIPVTFPPLRGVIHSAGVLADGMIFDMSLDRWRKPLAPKVQGTWNLHVATRERPLDFFVMFSSVACVLGSPGQSNYAAANSFLDGMVAYRHQLGLPATSINWGPWADAGMATEAGRDSQLSGRGMRMLASQKALPLLARLIEEKAGNVAVMKVVWPELVRSMGGKVIPILRNVISAKDLGTDEGSEEDRAFRESLVALSDEQRREKLTTFFAGQLAQIMGMEVEDVDVVVPLNTMGMDSLMAIELKNKIERRLQTALPMSALIHEPSVTSLATYVAENFGENGKATGDAGGASVADAVRTDGASRVVGPHASTRSSSGGTR